MMLTLDILEKYLLPIIAGNKTFEIREKKVGDVMTEVEEIR